MTIKGMLYSVDKNMDILFDFMSIEEKIQKKIIKPRLKNGIRFYLVKR